MSMDGQHDFGGNDYYNMNHTEIHIHRNEKYITSDMHGLVWGEPELTM